jgi:hypothetical protein
MKFNEKELRNISNSLKYWNVSEAQKECVNQIIKQVQEVEELKKSLKSIHDTITFSSKDWGKEKRDAWIYGVVCGWDKESYEEIALKFGWTDDDVERNKQLHKAYLNYS